MCIYLYRACYLKGFFSYQPDSLSYFRFLKVTPSMESLYTEKIKTQSTEQHRQKKKKNGITPLNIPRKKLSDMFIFGIKSKTTSQKSY